MPPINVLLSTKGHPFQRDPFFSMFDSFQRDDFRHTQAPEIVACRNQSSAGVAR